jgi:hypothetical protein
MMNQKGQNEAKTRLTEIFPVDKITVIRRARGKGRVEVKKPGNGKKVLSRLSWWT